MRLSNPDYPSNSWKSCLEELLAPYLPVALLTAWFMDWHLRSHGIFVSVPWFGTSFFSSVAMVIGMGLFIAGLKSIRAPKRRQVSVFKSTIKPWLTLGTFTRICVAVAAFWMTLDAYITQKQCLQLLQPMIFDATVEHMDWLIHFGHYPSPGWFEAFSTPLWMHIVDFTYSLWYFLKLLLISFFVFLPRKVFVHFMLAMDALWTLGGWTTEWWPTLGPCFFRTDAMAPYGTIAHTLQTRLWTEYGGMGASSGDFISKFQGIAAFPSLHVGVATITVCFLWRRFPRFKPLLILYWAAIQYGSVYLGWHYAIDGYTSALMAILLYFVFKWITDAIYQPSAPQPVT
ncbi:MAG: phosphatase PAP2 family protein [Acidobacteria bacterium]|nr:phosphatase PAP2 family protein [Acidobacteriota bacterium]